jgi:hypothetical protein
MKVGARAMQRHVIGCSVVIVTITFLRPGLAAGVSQEEQAKLSSLQQKIDELDHAGKYRDAILGWVQILKDGATLDDLAESIPVFERNVRAQS